MSPRSRSSVAIPLPVRSRLQTKVLVLGLTCVLAPVILLGAYLLERNQRTLREKVHENLSNELARRTTELNDWAGDRLREMGRWSASFVVFEGVEALVHGRVADGRVRRDLTEFLSSIQGHNSHVYESLFIVDTHGAMLASTRDEELDGPSRRLVTGGAAPTEWMSPVFQSLRLGRPTMLVLQSIQDRDGHVTGYLAGRIDLSDLEARLGPPRSLSDIVFWMLDERGGVLARGGKILVPPGEEPFLVPITGPGAARSGVVSELTPAGSRSATLLTFGSLGGALRGALAATLSGSVAYRSLDESRRQVLAWGIPFVLAIVLVTSVGTRRLLRPILRLADGAKRMSHGDLDVSLPVAGNDEIAQLTRVFNEMAQRVRETQNELATTNEGLTEANVKLETLATTDGLTGLFNHRHFQESLIRELQLAERDGRFVSLLLLDLDHFKEFNDGFGHTEGDAALRRVANVVTTSVRTTDMTFRYGGEEIVVLLPSCGKEEAAAVAEKVREALRLCPHVIGSVEARITASIGVATFPEDGKAPRALVDAADAALYVAKSQGRNRVVVSRRARRRSGVFRL